MLWAPTPSVLVWKVATPLDRATVPMTVAPSRNSTLPVGVRPLGAIWLTVAVKLICWPKTVGLPGVAVKVVAVLALLTTWLGLRVRLLVPKIWSPR
jgi:hypothetical protein